MITEPVPFLANIALVAHADGKLSSSELGQLEAIRAEFKIKKSDFAAAIRSVEQGTHRLTPVGTFADQVKNLELILRVAYSDDDLDATEAALVTDFCKTLGLYQDQFDKLCAQVLASLKQAGKLCAACGASAASDARFCPGCGTSLSSEEAAVQLQFQIPPAGLSIEFAESTAASFPRALELATATAGFQSCQKNRKSWYLAAFPSGSVTDALPLADALAGVRNRRLYLDGQERPWDSVFGFSACATLRAAAYRPHVYCFGAEKSRLNPWGCQLAGMEWTEWGDWFSYGSWEKAGILGTKLHWRFDKPRIRHELNIALESCRYCPHLMPHLSEAVLHHLPDTIAPQNNPHWQFHRDYTEVPGSIKIVEKEGTGDFEYTTEYWADGIRPKGLSGLTDILGKALADLGDSSVSVDDLVH